MPQLQCIIVTPERTVHDAPAAYVALTLDDGEIGIAPSHAPMIGRLGCGEMRIKRSEDHVMHYYVEGGFVEVSEDVVTVMTNRAIPAAELDVKVIGEQVDAARSQTVRSAEELAEREQLVSRRRAQLRVARRGR